jgi:hypothetical protein
VNTETVRFFGMEIRPLTQPAENSVLVLAGRAGLSAIQLSLVRLSLQLEGERAAVQWIGRYREINRQGREKDR